MRAVYRLRAFFEACPIRLQRVLGVACARWDEARSLAPVRAPARVVDAPSRARLSAASKIPLKQTGRPKCSSPSVLLQRQHQHDLLIVPRGVLGRRWRMRGRGMPGCPTARPPRAWWTPITLQGVFCDCECTKETGRPKCASPFVLTPASAPRTPPISGQRRRQSQLLDGFSFSDLPEDAAVAGERPRLIEQLAVQICFSPRQAYCVS